MLEREDVNDLVLDLEQRIDAPVVTLAGFLKDQVSDGLP